MVLKKLQLHPPSLLHHYVFFPHIVVKRKREKRKSYIGYDIIHRELQLILSSGVCHILKEKLEIQVVVVVFYLRGIFTYFSVEGQLTSAFPLWTVCTPISLNGEPYRVLR